ncbi:MAG: hypothetical protein JNL74_05890 [Fibrobacteres bacterium]|nr:hypothetical protein [Fibrobacterota bacterium]
MKLIFCLLLVFALQAKPLFKILPLNYQYKTSETGMPSHVLPKLSLTAALDEYESGAFAIHADSAIKKLNVSCSLLKNKLTGRTISGSTIKLQMVEFVNCDSTGKERLPLRFLSLRDTGVLAGHNTTYFITLKSSDVIDTGLFQGQIKITADGIKDSIGVSFTVLPFRLKAPDKMRFIAAISNYGSMTEKEFRMLKNGGVDGVEFFLGKKCGVNVINNQGHVKIDMPVIDSTMKHMKSVGMRGPIFLMLGNDRKSHIEDKICEVFPEFKMTTSEKIFGKPLIIGPIGNPRFDSLYLEAVASIKSGIEKAGFEWIAAVMDEPMERSYQPFIERTKLIRSRFPDLKLVGVTQGNFAFTKSLEPYTDILITAGDYTTIENLARRKGKMFSVNTFQGAANEPGCSRAIFGTRVWRYNPGIMLFWSYNWNYGDPFVEYDSEEPDRFSSILYPPREGTDGFPTETPAWIGLREAIDDWSYARMLEELAAQKGQLSEFPIDDMKHAVGEWDFFEKEYDYPRDYSQLDTVRNQAAQAILKLLK